MTRKPRRQGERLIEFVVGEVFVFIKQTFPFPDWLFCDCRSERAGEVVGRSALSRIQILVSGNSAKSLASSSNQFAATPNRRFEFNKRSQLFIRAHNETLSVVAVRVHKFTHFLLILLHGLTISFWP
jgi:hypothetical protein